ncbi:MAG: trehalose-phosphatase [Deltaproteobacteria bacterium]|nr:trehalose-phosphatase [Deltaproteobacteria bacterium]
MPRLTAPRATPPLRLARRLRAGARRRGFVLDHDGTLVRFRRDPALAFPSRRARRAVEALLRRGHRVCIASGRPLSFLREAWPLPGLDLAGSHGGELATAEGKAAVRPDRRGGAARAMERALRRALRSCPAGLRVERKPAGVAVHVRGIPARGRFVWLGRARAAVAAALPPGFELIEGSWVIEARRHGTHKGRIPAGLRRASRSWRVLPVVAVGDDRTDEDLFAALRPGDLGVLVSRAPRATAARARLRSPGDAVRFLAAAGRS